MPVRSLQIDGQKWDVYPSGYITQYTQDEYDMRVGWGHSSTEQAVLFGRLAKVRRFVMFHHDPSHSDGQLDALFTYARDLWGDDGDGASIVMAHEGLQLEV